LNNLSGVEREQYIRAMFTSIASRYDLMNRLMTFGQDVRWRRELIRRVCLPPDGRVLDLGAGTGDLARETIRQYPESQVIAADFTLWMMQVGRSQPARANSDIQRIFWSAADAQQLPFPDEIFDAVVSGFLLRNISDLHSSLVEQLRVLKPGGMLLALDTTPPPHKFISPLIRFHLHSIIPLLGRIIAGQGKAYQYLPDSTERFLEPEQLAERLVAVGFHKVAFKRFMFGTVAIHWGIKALNGAQ